MTEDKILDYWDTLKKNNNLSTSKAMEEYISEGKGNPKDLSIAACCNFWGYPNELVKEMKSGRNADMAKRVLYVMSRLSKNGCMMSYYYSASNLEICQKIGYSFSEIIDSINFDRGYQDLFEVAQSFINVYGEEILKYLTTQRLELIYKSTVASTVKFQAQKLTIVLSILVEFVMQDYEKYKEYIPVIYKYMDKLRSGDQLNIICRMYNLNDETMSCFKKYISNSHYDSAMWGYFDKYHGKNSLKDEMYKLGLQKNYYRDVMTDSINAIWDSKKKILDELYKENRDLFAEVCYELLCDKKNNSNSELAVYPLAVMITNNDGEKELEKALENIPHYIHIMTDYFQREGMDIKFAEFMKMINSDDIDSESIKFNFTPYGFHHGIGKIFEVFSLLYNFCEPAKRIVKLLLSSAYKNNNNHVLGEFYTTFMSVREKWLKADKSENNKLISEILPVDAFFKIYCYSKSNVWYAHYTKIDTDEVIRYAEENPDIALKFFDSIKEVSDVCNWLELYYSLDIEKNFEPLINGLKSKSKLTRKKAFEIAENYENEIRPELEKILPKLKGDAGLNVSQLIKKWDNIRKFGKDFAFTSNEFTEEFCKENLNPSAVRKISWIDEQCFDGIRYADLSGTASPNIMKYIISEYMILDEPYRISSCDKVANCLNKSDFQSSLENIFRLWVEDGADTKKKFISLPYCIYASDTQILKLKKQLEVWAGASRGALASFVVKNMALNGGSIALLTVDTISKKFPNNMVKNAAKGAMEFAAESLEVSIDELTDKIVPNLGFDKNGEKIFDYGARTFTVSLMPDFSLSIHDNAKNKDIKSLPKPNDKDDAIKAENAKKELSELKKQIKAVIASQKQRLERVLMNGRTWNIEKWRNLFEENAVMHCFAEKLIWGTYEDGKLKDTFRYLSDGSFCNEEDDEYELPENAQITLVHPVELSDELIAKWSEQLEDYEIIQPFNQLFAKVINLNDDDISPDNTVVKYDGKQFTVSKITSAAKKYDMARGYVGDGGSFDGYVLEDKHLGISMLICADMLYFGQGYDEVVTMQAIKFYMNEDRKEIPVNPKTLKSRFVSSCLEIAENIVDM